MNPMKKILHLILLMITFFIITACDKFPDPGDLPEKGGLSIIIVHPSNEEMGKPDFLMNHEYDVFKIIQVDYNAVDKIYPSLNIDSAPYYLFLDSKGIAFETK